MKIIPQEEMLLRSLKEYYKKKPNSLNIVFSIVTQKTGVSLRLLDWVVTNYAKTENVKYIHNSKNVNIYRSYKGELDAYSKKKFDPFCRRERIFYNMKINEHIKINSSDKKCKQFVNLDNGFVTTVGQLNFFRWAIEHGIIKYALDNLECLEKNMLDSTKNKPKQKKNNEQVKKKYVSNEPPMQKIFVKFDSMI